MIISSVCEVPSKFAKHISVKKNCCRSVCVCVSVYVVGGVGGSIRGRGRETRSRKRPEVPLNELPFNIVTWMGKFSVSRNALCSEYWIKQGSSSVILVWRIGTELSWWEFFFLYRCFACTRFSWNELEKLNCCHSCRCSNQEHPRCPGVSLCGTCNFSCVLVTYFGW